MWEDSWGWIGGVWEHAGIIPVNNFVFSLNFLSVIFRLLRYLGHITIVYF